MHLLPYFGGKIGQHVQFESAQHHGRGEEDVQFAQVGAAGLVDAVEAFYGVAVALAEWQEVWE